MPINKDGVMIILSSPSGAGKTTLVNLLSKKNKYVISISHTTRNPRPGEINNKHYYFVNHNEFQRLIKNEEFLEYAKVFNNYYGSSKDVVFKKLDNGENVIFDIDWQGTEQIKQKNLKYKIITIFILPPSREELFNRLLNRDLNDEKNAKERMKQFDKDVMHWKNYDLVVINDNFNKCYNNIIKYINLETKNITEIYNKNDIENHVLGLLK